MKPNWKLILLLGLLVVSFFSRIYKIDTLSLFGDEIDVGYQAFSILNTNRDYKGNFLPIYIQSLSESRAPLLIYFSIPGIKIFGLNELGVRITPIIFGVLSIFLFYKLILFFSKSFKLAFTGALILSLTPWHFHYSRTSFEVTLLLSLILLGVYFFQKFIQSSKTKFLYICIISFGLTFYTYNTANIFVPLLVLFLLFTNFKKILSLLNPTKTIISFGITLLFVIPISIQVFSGHAANRFELISIFNDQKTISQIIDRRTSFSAVNPQNERFFYNKATGWFNIFSQNYLEAVSPSFLFSKGDTTNIRHNLPQFGLLFLALFPLFIVGLLHFNKKDKFHQLMLFWLIISPIASSLTVQGGHHPTRLFIMLIPLSFFISLGINSLFSSSKAFSKIILIFLSFLLIFEIYSYSHEYFNRYPKDSFEYWNYGYKEIMSNIPQGYNHIYISNRRYNSLLPYAFYQKNKLLPLSDQEQKNITHNINGFALNQNSFFINDWGQPDVLSKIQQISQSKDVFILFQREDIPGDMNFSKEPIPGFKTVITVLNPNNTIFAQIIQKI